MTNPNCRWHHGMCSSAYRDDDPGRCPFCHRAWQRILRDVAEGDRHSCESRRIWPRHDQWRSIVARNMRVLAQKARQDGERDQVGIVAYPGLSQAVRTRSDAGRVAAPGAPVGGAVRRGSSRQRAGGRR